MPRIDPKLKELEMLIDREVRPLNFRKKGRKWIRETPETISRLTLRKDLWRAFQCYLEIDVSVKELNRSLNEEPVWHLTGSRFSPNVRETREWEECLNLAKAEVGNISREARLTQILNLKIAPLLKSFESLEGIKTALFSGSARALGVRTELQNLTGYHV